ncbi:hypothetical protein QAD02_005087 [Eretmocerus hayati]|uniref:Uncharacterized protein n=1 Tax=Eretmocerus hayati TaxID=131215 RepID=A0ACC2NRB5_9HYME|nr:hypothetical protein QAD02_005087 [Eretmocerus hayati]
MAHELPSKSFIVPHVYYASDRHRIVTLRWTLPSWHDHPMYRNFTSKINKSRKRIIVREDSSNESDEDVPDRGDEIPREISSAAEEAQENTFPSRSKGYYEKVYEDFVNWKKSKKTRVTNEVVLLAYFNELAKEYAASTMYNKHSILKIMIQRREEINIGNYIKLDKFLKAQNVGFEPTKAAALTTEEMGHFINKADDREFLFEKVSSCYGLKTGWV